MPKKEKKKYIVYLIVQSGDPVEFLSQFKFKFTPKSAVYFKAEDKLKPARILDTRIPQVIHVTRLILMAI